MNKEKLPAIRYFPDILKLLCLLTLLLLTGCVGSFVQTIQISSMAQKKQHHQIIQTLQPQLENKGSLSAFDLLILGGAYYEIRDYQRCLKTTHLLQARIDQGETSYLGGNLTPYPHLLQGLVYLDQGAYTQAVHFADQAYRLIDSPAGRSNQWFTSQLIQTAEISGVAQALQGNQAEARRWLVTIQNIAIDPSGIQGPEKYVTIAKINMALKDYQGALAALRHPQAKVTGAITIWYDQTFQELPRFFIETKALFETGATQQAKQGYDQLLKHPQIKEVGSMYWPVLLDRARIALGEGDQTFAESLLKEAVEIVELQRATITTEAGRIGFVGDKQDIYQELVKLLVTTNKTAQAFQYVERSKSRALVDLLASTKGFSPQSSTGLQTRSIIQKLEQAEQDLGVIPAVDIVTSPSKNTRGLVISLKRELSAASPELASLVSVTNQSISEIQSRLNQQETLLEYYGTGNTWYAFILKCDDIKVRVLTQKGLEESIQRFREQLSTHQKSDYQQTSRLLYNQLIAPVADLLTERVTIVPHGALHYLPFSALQKGNDMFIDKHIIRILPAAGVLKYLKADADQRTKPTLLLGNPDRGDISLNLQHAQEEVQAIARLEPGSTMFLGNKATVSVVTQSGEKFGRIHIAAHGIFDAVVPLNSALLLAKEGKKDGLLRASDLYRLKLNTDLVTLSACETALSKVAKGDDLLGFTRGFLYAGTKSIVASLWKVDDLATRDLMVAFYSNLSSMDKAEALAKAQREIRKKHPHPYYWAAFQLTGMAD